MKFIIIHGSFEHTTDAWFMWLKKELEKLGHEVLLPQFQVDQWDEVAKRSAQEYRPTQSLSTWLTTFETTLPVLRKHNDICFVGHSLGPLFTLILVQKYGLQLRKAYFVAPFLHPATEEELKDKSAALIHKANITFYYHDFDFTRLRLLIPHSTVIYSDDDPNVHEWEALEFAEKLGSTTIKLTGLGHMGSESGMKEFPQLLDAIKQDNP